MAEEIKYVEEAPESQPSVREKLAWVPGYPRDRLDEFLDNIALLVRQAREQASLAETRASQATLEAYNAAGSRRAAAASALEGLGYKQAADKSAADSATEADRSSDEADRAKEEADRAKKTVDEFDPGIYRYGYTQQVPQLEQNTILVQGVEFGYTYHVRKRSVCVLPSMFSDPTLKVGQLVHFQSRASGIHGQTNGTAYRTKHFLRFHRHQPQHNQMSSLNHIV
jgi:hypothetical protein